jgi:zinc D-Ala-D-Ala dipeptidase
MVAMLGLLPFLLLPTTSATAGDEALRRAGLVELVDLDSTFRLDIRYATPRNFTGRRLAGYCEPRAYLLGRAARALVRVQRQLAREGFGLKVFDGYRPARASRAMVRWAKRTGRTWLLNGYIARRSNHNLGAAVDVTLFDPEAGKSLGMGTAYDAFTRRSHTTNARGTALRNRLRLKRAMEREGFRNYFREWWHYDFRSPGARRLDIPIGC